MVEGKTEPFGRSENPLGIVTRNFERDIFPNVKTMIRESVSIYVPASIKLGDTSVTIRLYCTSSRSNRGWRDMPEQRRAQIRARCETPTAVKFHDFVQQDEASGKQSCIRVRS